MKERASLIASWFGFLGVIFFVFTTFLAGLLLPNYSHFSQLISESYATGTPYGEYLRYLGFIPSGIFIATFAFFAVKGLPESRLTSFGFLGIGVFYGIATSIVGLFPCDEGCGSELVDPSLSQLVHNIMGSLTYMIVPLSLILVGVAARKWPASQYVFYAGIICGLSAVIFVGILSSNLESRFTGLYQRIVEGFILLFITICCIYFRSSQKD